ncbi:signal protein PDZ [Chitinophaga parva]|uniref:Signal protein PDZ n=1 Tax=Chitinophaga parva TaxID=2169414 RepID=A0A2T7BLC0_9BACT|nr:aspartyl protease family protein [Chitinophaga parva]PUZ28439.1 signal protein PDZ [Chitinophaga parva]
MQSKIFHVHLLLAILVATHCAYGQHTEEKPLARFPFRQFFGGVVVVKAVLDPLPDTLQFIFDTGSAGISLDSAACKRMGITSVPSSTVIRGLGGSRQAQFVYNRTLRFPDFQLDSLNFHVNDYEAISQVYGVRVDGIIGYSLINRFVVQVDYDKEEIRLYPKGDFRYPRGGTLLHPNMNMIPVVNAPLRNGKGSANGHYYFDTGAGMCLLLSNQYLTDSSLHLRRRFKRTRTEAEGLNGKLEMDLTTMQEFRLGSFVFRNVPTYLFDDVSNITQYPSLGGLIGNDLLRRFNLTLNYGKKEIYLEPNSHFNEMFDYSYTGLIIYLINERATVVEVIPHSPAEKAGFLQGDIVLAVNKIFTNNLQVYRDQLKYPGTKAEMVISRNGNLMIKKLPVKSIL